MILVMYVKFSCDRWTNLSGAGLSVQKVSKFSVASIRYGDDPSRYS